MNLSSSVSEITDPGVNENLLELNLKCSTRNCWLAAFPGSYVSNGSAELRTTPNVKLSDGRVKFPSGTVSQHEVGLRKGVVHNSPGGVL